MALPPYSSPSDDASASRGALYSSGRKKSPSACSMFFSSDPFWTMAFSTLASTDFDRFIIFAACAPIYPLSGLRPETLWPFLDFSTLSDQRSVLSAAAFSLFISFFNVSFFAIS
jgi:hypothetical protein